MSTRANLLSTAQLEDTIRIMSDFNIFNLRHINVATLDTETKKQYANKLFRNMSEEQFKSFLRRRVYRSRREFIRDFNFNLKFRRQNYVRNLQPQHIQKPHKYNPKPSSDNEFEYLKSIKPMSKEYSHNESDVEAFKYLNIFRPASPPAPKTVSRYIDSEEYKQNNPDDEDDMTPEQVMQLLEKYRQMPTDYPKYKDQQVEFIKDKMYDARIHRPKTAELQFQDLLKQLNKEPYNTVIDLRKLDVIKEDVLEQLLEWFENNIASKLAEDLYVEFQLTNYSHPWLIPLNKCIDNVRKLFAEGNLFSIEEENSGIDSDQCAKLYWNLVDTISFKENHKPNTPTKLRKSHANGFFPRKLTKEYKEWEQILERYQIYYSYTTSEGKLKPAVRMSCLIHCLELSGVSKDICVNILSEVGYQKRTQRTLLTEIGNKFNLYFHLRIYNEKSGKIDNANQNTNGWYGKRNGKEIRLAEYLDHFFLDEELPVNKFAIEHWIDIKNFCSNKSLEWMMKVSRQQQGTYKADTKRAKATSLEVVIALDKAGAFEAIDAKSADVQKAQIFTSEVKEEEPVARPYNWQIETNKIQRKEKKSEERSIFYADIETCKKTSGDNVIAHPFMLCASNVNGKWKKTYTGDACVDDFLNDLPKDALVYFHNLGFDGNFFKRYGHNVMIQKGSKIMSMQAKLKNKTIILRDSYSLLAKPLRDFPKTFPEAFPEDMQKEVFPYDYYTYETIHAATGSITDALQHINTAPGGDPNSVGEDHQQFINNIDAIGARIGNDSFDMMKYARFYCERDVEVLRIGFNQFVKLAAKDPLNMNIHNFISAPSLAYEYMLQNVFYPAGNIFNVGGQLQRYLQKFVYGGRVMTRRNVRYDIKKKLADFDACSLYPSAMRRAFTVEGVPEYYRNPTPEQVFNKHNLPEILQKAFTEDQKKSTEEHCYSQFFIEIQITDIGIKRDFPLIVKREDGKQSNVNECVKMFVDMIMLQDLIEFQDISFTFVDGYVMKGGRDHRIREVIKKLYDLRVEFKKTKNPMQEVIKLIMNSAYGKSIQKVIKTELKYVDDEDIAFKLHDWYHQVVKAERISDQKWLVEKYKRKSNQFNNCIFGITVLSMSKRIMNEVMCLAEDLGIDIYYQDTDSMHIDWDRVEELDREFTKKYSRALIGTGMGNFHTDFTPANAYCIRHISLGKKMYLDVLEFEDSNSEIQHCNHIRMKGIPEKVIINHANKNFNGDVTKLYENIFAGNDIEFNLLDGKVCMKASRNGTVTYVPKFSRIVKATA